MKYLLLQNICRIFKTTESKNDIHKKLGCTITVPTEAQKIFTDVYKKNIERDTKTFVEDLIRKKILPKLNVPIYTVNSTYFQKFPLPQLEHLDERLDYTCIWRCKFRYCLCFLTVMLIVATYFLVQFWFHIIKC